MPDLYAYANDGLYNTICLPGGSIKVGTIFNPTMLVHTLLRTLLLAAHLAAHRPFRNHRISRNVEGDERTDEDRRG